MAFNNSGIAGSCLLALLVASTLLQAETFVETFDGGANTGGWSYFGTTPDGKGGPAYNEWYPTGGNPDAWIQTAPGYATFAPNLQSQPGATSIFTGNWHQQQVSSIGVDLITPYSEWGADGRPITLRVFNDNGTPYEYIDDYGFWYVGSINMPLPGEGWKSYDFAIDSQSMTTPAGWIPYRYDGQDASNLSWHEVMVDVDRIEFYHGEPDYFYLLQEWSLGTDNVRITHGPTQQCIGDIAPAGGDGTVNVNDLLTVINAWGAGGAGVPADIDQDGLVNVNDLLAVINGWGACPE